MIEATETIDEFLLQHAGDVEDAIRKAARTEILPRWRRLADHEVDQKSGPHDLVTDADRLAERYLTGRSAPCCRAPSWSAKRRCTRTRRPTRRSRATRRCG